MAVVALGVRRAGKPAVAAAPAFTRRFAALAAARVHEAVAANRNLAGIVDADAPGLIQTQGSVEERRSLHAGSRIGVAGLLAVAQVAVLAVRAAQTPDPVGKVAEINGLHVSGEVLIHAVSGRVQVGVRVGVTHDDRIFTEPVAPAHGKDGAKQKNLASSVLHDSPRPQ